MAASIADVIVVVATPTLSMLVRILVIAPSSCLDSIPIGATTTKKCLSIAARLDQNEYLKGIKFTDEEMAKLNMKSHNIHPKWNYTILPKSD